MEDYPKTLLELEQRFSTEEACEQYLFDLRWPSGFRCPPCGNHKAWELKTGLFECSACGHKASVISGTILEGTRKPLVLWFRVIWWVASQKNGASALGLQRTLGLGCYKTAWTWLHKLRRAVVRPGRDRLSGTIQVDETCVGGERPGKRGRGAAGKTLVVIIAQEDEHSTGRIRLKHVLDATGKSLEGAIKEAVVPGSTIKTDAWKGYNRLTSLGYKHEVIRDTADIGENLLPLCHRQASLLKRWLGGTHQGAVSHEHLDFYLDEYTFRFNRRSSRYRGKLFYRLLQNVVSSEPAPYSAIRKGIRGPKSKEHKI